jgi:D-aspartate oxidase
VTEDILKRALALCPELVSPNYTFDTSPAPSLEDLKSKVLEVGCGLRPARKGGIRLEAETMKTTQRLGTKVIEVPVVYNYGWVISSK